ncbi:MAG: polysaccharide deacetylase family protein [Bacilli bacterium]|nr:polysaccharide deacetylase family protein [Bacilli bacterium]
MKKYVVIIILFLLISIGLVSASLYNKNEVKKQEEIKLKTIETIKSHYNKYVETNKESIIYDDYNQKVGKIGANVQIDLEDIEIDENTKYFKISNLNYNIKYEDVKPSVDAIIDTRYKKYVVFNENIVTKDVTNFYNNKGLVYSINESFELPIIIKEKDKYYIEYDNQLLYVLKSNVIKTEASNNTNLKTRRNIRPLLYHFITKAKNCNSIICMYYTKFDEQMKWLKDNDYLTLRMNEVELFLDGKIRIPEKSTFITIDDGAQAENTIPILEKYDLTATLFVITGWHNTNKFKSDNLELHSHSTDMHTPGVCSGGSQGAAILCWSEEKILKDLEASRKVLNNTTYFAYPLYDYNERAIRLLKESGFTMAFIGAAGVNGVATPGVDKMRVPRLALFSDLTLSKFINYVSNY